MPNHEVDYLGHIIGVDGIIAASSKVVVMLEWPKSVIVNYLGGFLELTSYYNKLIRHYDPIATPFMQLLWKNNFN